MLAHPLEPGNQNNTTCSGDYEGKRNFWPSTKSNFTNLLHFYKERRNKKVFDNRREMILIRLATRWLRNTLYFDLRNYKGQGVLENPRNSR